MKTKNLNDFLKKNKKKVKVIEDSRARESICFKITEGCTFTDDEMVSSDILSSDMLSSEYKYDYKGDGFKCSEDSVNDVIIEEVVKDDFVKKTVFSSTTIDNRINKIKQFTNLNLHIDHSKLEPYLVLPKNLLRISKIFKALITIQNYNLVRKLTSIFIKIKGSIERTLNTMVEEEDIKKIYFLIFDKIELKPLSIEEKGKMVKTFTYKINCTGEEMDRRLLEFYKMSKEEKVPQKEFMEVNDFEDKKVDGKADKEDVYKGVDIDCVDRKDYRDYIYEQVNRNVYDQEAVNKELNTQSINFNSSTTQSSNIQLTVLNKTNFILERIKQKELKRKEEFTKKMQKKNEERDLIKRIISLFKKESKKALKIDKIVKILEIYEGNRQIKKIVEDNSKIFEIRKILDERKIIEDEYLIYLE